MRSSPSAEGKSALKSLASGSRDANSDALLRVAAVIVPSLSL